MAPEEENKESQEKPKSNKLLIVIALLVVLLGAGGAGAYFKFFKASDEKTESKKHEENAIYEMDTFMVNLSDPGGKHFLKAVMKLKVSSAETSEECKSRTFELRDRVLTLLSGKESEEITSADDKAALKRQVMETVNSVLQKGKVLDVYFTDFLVQ